MISGEEINNKKVSFGTPDTVSGTYYFNELYGQWQLKIECIDYDLVLDGVYRFSTKEEMQNFVNNNYNTNFKFS